MLHRVNEMNFVSELREPKRVCAGSTSDVKDAGRGFGESLPHQFFRALEFQLKGTSSKALGFGRLLIVVANLRIQLHCCLTRLPVFCGLVPTFFADGSTRCPHKARATAPLQ